MGIIILSALVGALLTVRFADAGAIDSGVTAPC
jgi:hypothetical protein